MAISYGTSDPRKIASQQRQVIAQQGGALNQEAAQRAQQNELSRSNTADYLGDIEDPLAKGLGGYNADELSQIKMTPEEQQRIVTGAGISAGTGTAAAVQAAQRAAAAAGGNPLALAAYRARAANTEGALAGDAMTQARVAASNAAAQRAENIGQARMGQQNQGLSYYQNLLNQQNQNAQNEYQRQQQTYGTETSGGNQAAGLGIQASQTPSTFDKVMGGVSTAASFLEEGDISAGKTPAVVGDDGPEKVVQLPDNDADYAYMDNGGIASGAPPAPLSLASTPNTSDYLAMRAAPSSGSTSVNPDGSLSFTPAGPGVSQGPGFWKRLGMGIQSRMSQPAQPNNQQRDWNPTDTYRSIGASASRIGSAFLADGGIATPTSEVADMSWQQMTLNPRTGRYEPILGSRKHSTVPMRPITAAEFNDDGGQPRPVSQPQQAVTMERYVLPAWQPRPGGPWEPILGARKQRVGRPVTVPMRPITEAEFNDDGGQPPMADGGIASAGGKERVRHANPPAGSLSRHGIFPTPEGDVAATQAQGRNGVFTAPTRVNLSRNEAVVPLNYRAGAKVRPSLAALPAAQNRPRGAYRA